MNKEISKTIRSRMTITDDELQALDLRSFNNGKGPYSESDSSWKNTFKPGLKFFRNTVSRRTGFTSGEKVLDLLCGFGRWTPFLAEENDFVVGLDCSPDCITVARNMCDYLSVKNVEFINDDITRIEKFADKSFDYVWMYSAMQYVERGYVLPHVWRMLKPGGRLFVADYTSMGLMIEHVEQGIKNQAINEGASQWALKALANGAEGDSNPNFGTLDTCQSICERFGFSLIKASTPRGLDLSIDGMDSTDRDIKLMYGHYCRAIEFIAEKRSDNNNIYKAENRLGMAYRCSHLIKKIINHIIRKYLSDI